MAFNVKRRGKVTYYYEGETPVLSSLVVETLPDGDLKIHFLVFECWERWLREAGICASIADVDFLEIHAFGAQPKTPNPLADPLGYAQEQDRLRKAYAAAYASFFRERCPNNGVPARFTVHLIDFPDKAASYEFYGTALYQRSLQTATTDEA
jgi:hypothetical protein